MALVAGCDSAEDQCETLCEWADDCGGGADCSEDEIEECADDVNDIDDEGCEDAFEAFVDCLEENENDCEDVVDSCQGEATDFLEECEGEI